MPRDFLDSLFRGGGGSRPAPGGVTSPPTAPGGGGGFLGGLGKVIDFLGPSYQSENFSISFDREGREREEMLARLFAILEGPQAGAGGPQGATGRAQPNIQYIGGNQGRSSEITQMDMLNRQNFGSPMRLGVGFPGVR